MASSAATCLVDLPSATSWATWRSREVSRLRSSAPAAAGIHHGLRDARPDVKPAARHLLDGLGEVLARLGLEHEPPHAGADRLRHQALLLERREHHDLDAGPRLDDLARGIDAVQERHHDVEHRDVRFMLPRQFDRRPAVGRLGHHVEAVPFEQGAHALS